MSPEKRTDEIISIAMWSIRRLESPFNRVTMLKQLLSKIEETHPYRHEINRMLQESQKEVDEKEQLSSKAKR